MADGRILRLTPEVIGQIAAGEVVERPSAAVKELVENSMDAGAGSVTVEIRDGGLTYIRVSDNGSGIAGEDLRMAFERHATSKIRDAADLHSLGTLGFRGEALASIAAVSRVTLLTRRRGSGSGVTAVNEGGLLARIEEAACAEGTSVTVRDLFYNAPVRRGFMKKPAAEAAQVTDLVTRLILSHPEVSFRLVSEGKTVLFSPGDGRLESAVMSVYGVAALRSFVPAEGNRSGALIWGYVGVGDAARGNRAHQLFFLNGRAIRSDLLSQALEEACRQRVTASRFPLCVLHLQLPFSSVDVNVHPNKWEVRFADEKAVSGALREVVSAALSGGGAQALPPPLLPEAPEPARQTPAQVSRREVIPFEAPPAGTPEEAPPAAAAEPRDAMRLMDPAREETKESPGRPEPPGGQKEKQAEAPGLETPALAPRLAGTQVRLIGSAFNTYILFESGGALILCDQHALHERLIYDRMVRALDGGVLSQMLLSPLIVPLSAREYGSFLQYRALLQEAGFDAEDFGGRSLRLLSVPMQLGEPFAEGCLKEALDELEATGSLSDRRRLERILQTACKHAVKGGERLPEETLLALVRDMLEGNVTPTCPHGRPLMLSLTRAELDRRFRRVQG